ncbi:MAG: 2-oxoglutarate dehydrogenase E1 component [Desulfobacteraceae bacterium]|jgi:2-oxoglutarate dehydrogenase E1 component
MKIPETLNLDYLDSQYRQYKSDPGSVSREWQIFFNGFDIGLQHPAADADACEDASAAQVAEMINRYRELGHLLACMDPLSACPTSHPMLELTEFGLSNDDFGKTFFTPQFSFLEKAPLKDILNVLKQTYCRSVGVEYMHLQDPDERSWLQARMEPVRNKPEPDDGEKRRILEKLTHAAMLEQFLNKKYQAVTRFSLEGGDALIPMLDSMLQHLAGLGATEVILGMAHRGRLNVQVNILNKPFEELFAEFETCYDAGQLIGDGDVKYHNGYLSNIELPGGRSISAFLVNNPSHLEAVNPVVEGIVRARQQMLGDVDRKQVIPLLLHGDAAFAGQGIVPETLNMSQLAGYTTGGTIHVVINNQIGYTTLPEDARSTRYSTDVAKMLMVPIFHVHGEDPESLIHVAKLAAEYRTRFAKDVVIDLVCYRRYGHNEGDEPYFTQPRMYDRIKTRPSPHLLYSRHLEASGVIDDQVMPGLEAQATAKLESAYQEIHGSACLFPQPSCFKEMQGYHGRYSHDPVTTSVSRERLSSLAERLNTLPPDFTPHNKIKMLLRRRLQSIEKGEGIDWANAEALAFASLLTEAVPIRLSGQDCQRGTFSQRHSVLFDRKTGRPHVPLNALEDQQAPYHVHNSLLAEAGVLGFEYGYAMSLPQALTLWEAQFGDFVNNAQGIVDLFIASGETKWQCLNGLCLLLPHGWEGLGPEHSSARLERFLQLCADDNWQVCNLTTPAQYFHLLRRQAKAAYRKPLVLMTPKSLLRHPQALSTLSDLSDGVFAPVLDDPQRPAAAAKVLLCSGKIYYQLVQRCNETDRRDIAVVRLEQFYPFPRAALQSILEHYGRTTSWCWVQEEPENMGAWWFLRPRLEEMIGKTVQYVGRPAAASPATGFPNIYKQQQATISDRAVGPEATLSA